MKPKTHPLQVSTPLPLPPHYDPVKVGQVWQVPYQERAEQAFQWSRTYGIQPAAGDQFKIALLVVDMQNTFCVPGYELFVSGRSGMGGVEDNRRLTEFIYHNLHALTHLILTLDTHYAMQIFHPVFLVNEAGEHPAPLTLISHEDILKGNWKVNPAIALGLGIDPQYGQEHLLYYTRQLRSSHKYDLTIWPYHAMLGGIGHALVSVVEEAVFFHTISRYTQPEYTIKGQSPITESYSAIGPEVLTDARGAPIAEKKRRFLDVLVEFDALVIAGEAKSHCVAWTVEDLLSQIQSVDPGLAKKVYLLEDCTSAVVVPGVVDYTLEAEKAFQKFSEAGMHLVHSTEPIANWPGIGENPD